MCFFYMFWVGLVAYIFHEMDGKFKDVPSTKANIMRRSGSWAKHILNLQTDV